MIYDCFSFFNELDLLEIRLNTLANVVNKFILVEAPITHTGNPKPLYFAENKARFANFEDRIIHIVVDDFPEMSNETSIREKAWMRENWQRNAIVKGLPKNINNDDILLISDLDEIPSPEHVLCAAKNPTGITRLNMKAYCFFINLRNISYPIWDNGTKILTWKTFNSPDTYSNSKYTECCIAAVNQGPTATRVRFLKPDKILKNAGWHFSYLGGIEAIQHKMKSIAHTEFDTEKRTSLENIRNRLMRGRGFINSAERFLPEIIDKTFPNEITQNKQKYQNLISAVIQNKNPSKTVCLFFRTNAVLRDLLFFLIAKATPNFLKKLRHHLYCKISNTNA